ncbi:MAG: ATPase, partial [Massilia sp.]|nr:ATPase [Massilia sp.]
MIDFIIGVDGGGTGTRVRLARADGSELSQGRAGPSALAHGIVNAWASVDSAVAAAFANAALPQPALHTIAIGLGLAGV